MDQTIKHTHDVRGGASRPGAFRSEPQASRQDIVLFIAPPVLSAIVLAALYAYLPNLPSAHPLTDAMLLCTGASAILITCWWIVSFVCTLYEARATRQATHPIEPRTPRTPRIFRPLFMRRIVLTLGGTAIGLGAALAPAHATEAPHSPSSTAQTASSITSDAHSSGHHADSLSVAYRAESADAQIIALGEIPLAPSHTQSAGSPHDRSPFFVPSHNAQGTYAYTVRAGDTLWSIAAEQLGEGTEASVIYDYTLDIYSANREALGRNADVLYEGQVLQIPEQPLQTSHR